MAACASSMDNPQGIWSHQPNSNAYVSPEQQIKITFPDSKWQLYTEQETSPQVVRNIWKKPQYNGDSYNVAIALNPEDDVIIMHLKIIPANHPVFNDPFENMMIQMLNAYKFAIESADGKVENFKTEILQRNNKEIAIGELIYQEQKNFGAFLGLLKENDRLVLFEFYILKEHLAARENEFLKIIDSYERFDRTKLDLLSSNAKQQPDLESAESYVNRGNAFAQHQNQYSQALSAFNAAIEIDPDYAKAYISRGYLFKLYGQYAQAITDFSTALVLQPQAVVVLLNRGETYLKTGQYDKAIFDSTRAIEIKPHHAAYINRGYAYDAKGLYEQALSDYSKAIEIYPEYAEAYVNRGITYSKSDQHELGFADFNKAIEMGHQSMIVYGGRGNAYHLTEQYDQALSDYSKALELSPNANIYQNRGQAYVEKKEYDLAIEDFNKAIEINSGFAESYLERGNAYFYKGQYDQAISDYSKAIEIKPEFTLAFNNRGYAYTKSGQYDQAISDYNKAIATDQASASPYASLAWLLATCPNEKYRNGGKAIELAQKAIRISLHPNNLASLAAGYAEIGKFNEAIATQKKLIAILKQEGKTENLNDFMEKLDAYISHNPWREEVK